MLEWAAKRRAAVGKTLTLYADLTIAVAEELIKRGGAPGAEEGMLLLKVAVELFRVDGAALEGVEIQKVAAVGEGAAAEGTAEGMAEGQGAAGAANVLCGKLQHAVQALGVEGWNGKR